MEMTYFYVILKCPFCGKERPLKHNGAVSIIDEALRISSLTLRALLSLGEHLVYCQGKAFSNNKVHEIIRKHAKVVKDGRAEAAYKEAKRRKGIAKWDYYGLDP